MHLGISLGMGATVDPEVERVQLAERLGYDVVWAGENYGTDCITQLAYLAALTRHIRLGTSVMQVSARAPAVAAMEFQTLDALAGRGRVVAGIGVSGPQIVEGWFGRPWEKPYWLLRDYTQILRKVFAREAPVTHDGRILSLPYTGPGSHGMGKPLRMILHTNPDLPIWFGSSGPANTRLCGELADGLVPHHFAPRKMPEIRRLLEEGAARAGNGKSLDTFEVMPRVDVVLTDDVEEGLREIKPGISFRVGGMGHPDLNFHKNAIASLGYEEETDRIQELFLAGRRDEATEAVPDELIDEIAIVGPRERIASKFAEWRDCGVTGLTIISRDPRVLELMARVAEVEPVA